MRQQWRRPTERLPQRQAAGHGTVFDRPTTTKPSELARARTARMAGGVDSTCAPQLSKCSQERKGPLAEYLARHIPHLDNITGCRDL